MPRGTASIQWTFWNTTQSLPKEILPSIKQIVRHYISFLRYQMNYQAREQTKWKSSDCNWKRKYFNSQRRKEAVSYLCIRIYSHLIIFSFESIISSWFCFCSFLLCFWCHLKCWTFIRVTNTRLKESNRLLPKYFLQAFVGMKIFISLPLQKNSLIPQKIQIH